MTTLNLDELEQRAERHRVHGSCQIGTPDLLYLLAAARERDDLIESNGILRQQSVALAEERDALKADNERLRAALEYIASTGDPGFEVDDKTWWVWGENMRMKARTALVKP